MKVLTSTLFLIILTGCTGSNYIESKVRYSTNDHHANKYTMKLGQKLNTSKGKYDIGVQTYLPSNSAHIDEIELGIKYEW